MQRGAAYGDGEISRALVVRRAREVEHHDEDHREAVQERLDPGTEEDRGGVYADFHVVFLVLACVDRVCSLEIFSIRCGTAETE